jgi:hypothetical protein
VTNEYASSSIPIWLPYPKSSVTKQIM